MSKNSKQEIVQELLRRISEHLVKVDAITNEDEAIKFYVEGWSRSMLTTCLGFSEENGYKIDTPRANVLGPTLSVSEGERTVLAIEVIGLGTPMNQSILGSDKVNYTEFFRDIGMCRWGMLTNGFEWKLYDFDHDCCEVLYFDLRARKKEKTSIVEEKRGLGLLRFHELSLRSGDWSRCSEKSREISADLLVKTLLSSENINLISQQMRNKTRYGGTQKMLIDQMFRLLKPSFEKNSRLDRYVQTIKKDASKAEGDDLKKPEPPKSRMKSILNFFSSGAQYTSKKTTDEKTLVDQDLFIG